MGASGETMLAIGALAMLWLVIAAVIAAVAAQRFRLAQQVLEAAQANARLIDIMPARPLLVRVDRSVEVGLPAAARSWPRRNAAGPG